MQEPFLPGTKLANIDPSRVLVVGISGPSSSGKTTLARLLRDILTPLYCNDTTAHATSQKSPEEKSNSQTEGASDNPNAHKPVFILHQDDFYLHDSKIPVREDGLQDWDCLESLDLPGFVAALNHIHQSGKPPADLVSKEDQNEVGDSGVSETFVNDCREKLRTALSDGGLDLPSIAMIDGFLLFSPIISPVPDLFTLKLFLPCTRNLTVDRRGRRQGYVTLEGFWEDPPGYIEKVVWPNYSKDHAFLFVDGNVEGEVDNAVAEKCGLSVRDRSMMEDMPATLKWAVNVLIDELKSRK